MFAVLENTATLAGQFTFANRTFGLTDCLEIPLQMRPAYPAEQFVKIVGVIAIGYQLTRKAAYQFAGCFLAAVGMNHKKRRCHATESPPAGFCGFRRKLVR